MEVNVSSVYILSGSESQSLILAPGSWAPRAGSSATQLVQVPSETAGLGPEAGGGCW